MQKRLAPEVAPDPIVPAPGPSPRSLHGGDQGREVRPSRDRDVVPGSVGNSLRHRQAGLPVAIEKRMKVRTRHAEHVGPFAVRPAWVRGDVICKLFHAANVTHCDTSVKGAI